MPRIVKSKFFFYMCEKGLTQRKIAKQIEVPPQQLSGWVNGHRFPRDAKLRELLDILGAEASELVTFEEVKE